MPRLQLIIVIINIYTFFYWTTTVIAFVTTINKFSKGTAHESWEVRLSYCSIGKVWYCPWFFTKVFLLQYYSVYISPGSIVRKLKKGIFKKKIKRIYRKKVKKYPCKKIMAKVIMASVTYGKSNYGKCNYSKCIYGKSIM